MLQEERVDYLIKALQGSYAAYDVGDLPRDTKEKRQLLRALMNVRPPEPLDDRLLAVQDAYLQACIRENGIVELDDIPEACEGVSIWQGDITRLAVDAIVNAANSAMLGCFLPLHACIDNCIHTFAGMQLRLACHREMEALRSEYGEDYVQPTAVPLLTDAYNLPAKKIVHIVGPIVHHALTVALEDDLARCYRHTLDLCMEHHLKSVAFCCISTGVFRFPNRRAAEIAVATVKEWKEAHPETMERIIFNVFKDSDRMLYEEFV